MSTFRGSGTPSAGDNFPTVADLEAAVAAAAASALAAANSASTALAAQVGAELAETNAETAETNAETAQTAAEAAQSAAETAQTAAELAETNAETAETNAETAETAAQAAQTAAEAALDSFDDRYLGAKASDPTLDNDGNALLTGALYWKTSATVGMRAYNGSAWENVNQDSYTKTESDANFEPIDTAYTKAEGDAKYSIVADEAAWTAPTLLNSWTNFGSGHVNAGYRKGNNGVIHVRFMVKKGSGTAKDYVFRLPSGYRPSYTLIFTGYGGAGAVRWDILSDGNIEANINGSLTYQTLNCSFYPG